MLIRRVNPSSSTTRPESTWHHWNAEVDLVKSAIRLDRHPGRVAIGIAFEPREPSRDALVDPLRLASQSAPQVRTAAHRSGGESERSGVVPLPEHGGRSVPPGVERAEEAASSERADPSFELVPTASDGCWLVLDLEIHHTRLWSL